MFILGVAFVMGGYVLTYYALDVLVWSRSAVADKTRPVPIKYLIGLPVPTSAPTDVFHPPFTLNDTDRANAVTAMGGGSGSAPTGGLLTQTVPGTPHPASGA